MAPAWRNFKNIFFTICTWPNRLVGAKILSGFQFEGKSDVWISQVRRVKQVLLITNSFSYLYTYHKMWFPNFFFEVFQFLKANLMPLDISGQNHLCTLTNKVFFFRAKLQWSHWTLKYTLGCPWPEIWMTMLVVKIDLQYTQYCFIGNDYSNFEE